MREVFARLSASTGLRYLLASVLALAADIGCFLVLLQLAMPPASASAIGYALGIVVHWLLSSRAVFVGHVAPGGARRLRQKALFAGSALIGLALTTAIVGLATLIGLDPRLAKLVAVGVSFATTWALRQRVVFA